MKKTISLILFAATILSLTACNGQSPKTDIISSSAIIERPSSSEENSFPPEKPEVNDSIDSSSSLQSSSSQKPAVSSSSSVASSSSQAPKPSSSSSVASSSSQAPKPSSSSSVASSSSQAPKPSSSSSVASSSSQVSTPVSKPSSNTAQTVDGEVRAIWISYLEFDNVLKGKSKSQFQNNIKTMFNNISNFGFNTVFVQVRPYADALYPSAYFPWSQRVTGTEGVDPGFDPLQIMVTEARNKGLRIEAWINPYRVRTDKKNPLSDDNQAQIWLDEGHDGAIAYNNGIYYNPGNAEARQLIVNGVVEIVENYEIDGVHFDDYFYPTTDASFDKKTYNNSGTKLGLADWRRENVNILVRDVYSAIKSIDSSVVFGISPQGNMENNYNSQFIDVKKWLSNTGYIDYICPQVYFGFDNSGYPFSSTVSMFNDMIKVKGIDLYVGMAPYKLGTEDTWAGNGKNEWKNTTDILERMVLESRDNNNYKGFVMYRYDSLFNPSSAVKAQVEKEKQNLKAILD